VTIDAERDAARILRGQGVRQRRIEERLEVSAERAFDESRVDQR
jgi:hypothetical protein